MALLDRFRLDGKRCFLTGGSRGLGREMALAIAEAGADLILVGRDRPALEATGADVERRGRAAVLIQADVSQPLEAERACRTALERHGPITSWSTTSAAAGSSLPTASSTSQSGRRSST